MDADAAARAVDSLTGKELAGKSLYAGRAQKKAEREAMLRSQFEEKRAERVQKYQGMNLYVKNLHDDITDDILREEFTPFGSITSAKVGGVGRTARWVGCTGRDVWLVLAFLPPWEQGSVAIGNHGTVLHQAWPQSYGCFD